MGRTFKHDKDSDYAESEVRGSMSVDRNFASGKRKKKKDKQFRERRKRDFTLGCE